MALVSDLTEEERKRFGVTEKCTFCNGPSKYYWYEGECIEFCKDCGLTFLPRMLADMVDTGEKGDPDRLLEEVKSTYWRSVAGKYRIELEKEKGI